LELELKSVKEQYSKDVSELNVIKDLYEDEKK